MALNWDNIRHRIRLTLAGPKAPRFPQRLDSPAVIVGSAPCGTIPVGLDQSYRVFTVNASQARLDDWGVGKPDATFVHFFNIEGQSDHARSVRAALTGRRTGQLYVLRWQHGMERLECDIAALGYGYDGLHALSKYHRMALHLAVMRRINSEQENSVKFSNGMTALFFALVSGAPAVILSGIDPASDGHFHNPNGRMRLHSETDMAILTELRMRGEAIFTADPEVAKSAGLALWPGKLERGPARA